MASKVDKNGKNGNSDKNVTKLENQLNISNKQLKRVTRNLIKEKW